MESTGSYWKPVYNIFEEEQILPAKNEHPNTKREQIPENVPVLRYEISKAVFIRDTSGLLHAGEENEP